MSVPAMRWRPDQITFTIDENLTVGNVWTFNVNAPGYILQAMVNEGEVSPDGKRIVLSGAHMQGAGPNEIGLANLRMIGNRFC